MSDANSNWSPASWRERPIYQQPDYPDATALENALDEVRALPPLVNHGEVDALRAHLAKAELKTRDYDLIPEELAAAFEIHEEQGRQLRGVHFELTRDDVTECTGEPQELSEADLSRSYEIYCDPRLNYAQSLELALCIAQRLQTHRTAQS